MSIPNSVDKDKEVSKKILADLGYGVLGPLRPAVLAVRFSIGFLICFALLIVLYLFTASAPTAEETEVRYSFGSQVGIRLEARHYYFKKFLGRFGTGGEEALYRDLSVPAILAAQTYDNSIFNDSGSVPEGYQDSLFTKIYIGALFAWVQLVFLATAAWRFWVLGLLVGVFYGIKQFSVHAGRDIMGVLGNGSMFHSGLWIGLDNLTENGEPDVHAPGLACPQSVTAAEIDASPYNQLLVQYGANCPTNRALVGFLLADQTFPAWVSPRGVERVIERTYGDVPLFKHAYYVLEKALVLQALYRARVAEGGALTGDLEIVTEAIPGTQHKIAIEDYANYLVGCFHNSLTPNLRRALAEITPSELAAIILGSQAGLLMTYDKEVGNTWSVVSCFPELNARAVLHSIAALSDDFSFYRRQLIRRALIYSARSSLFELNRLPVDLDDQTLAARQLVELVLTPPHLVSQVAPEVQLYGLAKQVHSTWKHHFLGLLSGTEAPSFRKDCFVGPGDVLFVPLAKLLATFRSVIEPSTFDKLLELAEQGAQFKEQLAKTKQAVPPHLNHLLQPTTEEFVQHLMHEHDLCAQDVRHWLGLRYVLRSYSWLAQRVGDKANGPGQLIFLIREKQRTVGTNNEDEPFKRVSEFSGSSGIVPLRTTQITEELGDSWLNGFVQVKRIHVPLKRADFYKLIDSSAPKKVKDDKHNNDKHNDLVSAKDMARGNFRKVTLRAM